MKSSDIEKKKILVVIANYGPSQISLLEQVVRSFKSFKKYDTDILIHSNIEIKNAFINENSRTEIIHLKDYQYLPFSCRKPIIDNIDNYDLFIYTENDMLHTEENIDRYVEASEILKGTKYIPGFFQFEVHDGNKTYPAFHGHYNWDYGNIFHKDNYVFARFTNEHHAGICLTKYQLKAINDNFDFLSQSYNIRYAKNTPKVHACTNIYTEAGFTKVIPVSHFNDFLIRHLADKYKTLGCHNNDMQNHLVKIIKPQTDITRLDIILKFIGDNGYTSYLEIGCDRNQIFDKIQTPIKVGVDPRRGGTLRMESDRFFLKNTKTFDIIFVDGLHEERQVYKDIDNALKILNTNGVIICHDMCPYTEDTQVVPRITKIWTGDCWKAWLKLRAERSDLHMEVIDCDYGVGIIRKGTQKTIQPKEYSYQEFNDNKKELLNLVPVSKYFTPKTTATNEFKIIYTIPYSTDKNIGKAYNEVCSVIPDHYWIGITDGDISFLNPNWGHVIKETIEKNKDYTVFTGYASRIGTKQQRYNGELSEDANINNHYDIACHQAEINSRKVKSLTGSMSGFLMIFPKWLWHEIKFPESSQEGTMLGIDTEWSKKVLAKGYKIGIIEDMYVFHYYRLKNGKISKEHLA